MVRHIAMWSCPRSTSTVITRAFEQLEGCLVIDEPFYSPYLLNHGFNHPQRQEILDNVESDFHSVIKNITGDLPSGYQFSFQKHMSKHLLPEFQGDWLYSLDNFFLIRDLKKILLSYRKIYGEVTNGDLGMKILHDIFQDLQQKIGRAPLIISSEELLENPERNLRILCQQLKLDFSTKMLTWESGLKNSNLLGVFAPQYGHAWYGNVMNSTGFLPSANQEINLPNSLQKIFEEEVDYYQELYQQRMIFE